jgi:glycosyltransferase involved in cell wall biosynthesis
MKEKVCIVTSSMMTINAFLVAPIKKLSEQYDVSVVVNDSEANLEQSLKGIVTVISVNVERKISPIDDLSALIKLIALFKKQDFKLIHSVTPKAGLLAMLAAFFCQTKHRIHIFTGQVWATKTGISKFILKKIDRSVALLATDILVDSQSQKTFLINEGVVSQKKASILASGSISGVNTKKFRPNSAVKAAIRKELGISLNDTVFLFIGRLSRDKGILDLAEAFESLGDPASQLVVVGPDEDDLLHEVKSKLVNNHARLHIVGFSNKPEDYMAASDVLCLPSYREGFGSVIIEAAAVGIPAIGSRIYGIEDAIVDNETGLLFEARNKQALTFCMKKISAKPLMLQLGSNANARAEKEFSSELLAQEWLSYYRAKL